MHNSISLKSGECDFCLICRLKLKKSSIKIFLTSCLKILDYLPLNYLLISEESFLQHMGIFGSLFLCIGGEDQVLVLYMVLLIYVAYIR